MTGQGQLLAWICRTMETDCLALHSVSTAIAKRKKKPITHKHTEFVRPNIEIMDLLQAVY